MGQSDNIAKIRITPVPEEAVDLLLGGFRR